MGPLFGAAITADKLKDITACACRYGRLEMVKLMHTLAAARNHIEVVRFIHLNCRPQRIEWNLEWVSGGNVEIFKYFESIDGIYCDTNTMTHASTLELVKYIHYNRTEGCTSDAMDYDAVQGLLDIVKFLHFNRTEGCTTNAMDSAASKVTWMY
eukprot:gene16973-20198_t